MATHQLVIFSVMDEEFGIDVGQVNIIERPLEIFKIPNTPSYIEGLVNLRGKVYTVLNMRKRFNMPVKETDDNTKIVMVNTGASIVGLIVDSVREIIRVDDQDMENAPKIIGDLKRRFINGVAKVNERIILLLDMESILSEEEPAKAAK